MTKVYLKQRLAYAMQGHGIGKILRPAHKVYAVSCPLLKDKPTKYMFISLVMLIYCYQFLRVSLFCLSN